MLTIGRFFLLVSPWHPVAIASLAAVVMLESVLVVAGMIPPLNALGPIVVLQSLVASSGFAGPARRGHYDFLIAAGHTRTRIGLAHWAVCVAPGLLGWLVVAVSELVTRSAGPFRALTPAAVAAMIGMSSLSWAITVGLPRLTGGLLSIALAATAISTGPPNALPVWAMTVVTSFAMSVATLGAGAVAVGIALVWIQRVDLPLEAAQ
jgi:hypothetical protein